MLPRLEAEIIAHFGSELAFGKTIGMDQLRVSEIIHGKRELPRAEQIRWSRIIGINRKELSGNGQRMLDHTRTC